MDPSPGDKRQRVESGGFYRAEDQLRHEKDRREIFDLKEQLRRTEDDGRRRRDRFRRDMEEAQQIIDYLKDVRDMLEKNNDDLRDQIRRMSVMGGGAPIDEQVRDQIAAYRSELGSLETANAELRSQIEKLTESNRSMSARLDQSGVAWQTITGHESTIQTLKGENRSLQGTINSLREQLENQRSALANADVEIRRLIDSKRAAVADKEREHTAEIRALKNELETMTVALTRSNTAANAQQAEESKLKEQLKKTYKTLATRDKIIAKLNHDANVTKRNHDAKITKLNDDAKRETAALRSKIAALQASNPREEASKLEKQLRASLERTTNEAKRLAGMLRATEKAAYNQARTIADLNGDLKETKRQNELLVNEAKALQLKLAAINGAAPVANSSAASVADGDTSVVVDGTTPVADGGASVVANTGAASVADGDASVVADTCHLAPGVLIALGEEELVDERAAGVSQREIVPYYGTIIQAKHTKAHGLRWKVGFHTDGATPVIHLLQKDRVGSIDDIRKPAQWCVLAPASPQIRY